MKKAAYGLLAAFLAMGAYGDVPKTAEDWYKPPNGFTEQTAVGKIYYVDTDTSERTSLDVSVNDKGELLDVEDLVFDNVALQSAYGALKAALKAEANNKRQDEALETLGKNLHNVIRADGITVTGQDPNGVTRTYTLKFVSGHGLGSEGGAQVEDPTMRYKISDEKSLRWKEDNKLEIYGWSSDGPSLNLSEAISEDRPDLNVYDIPVRYNHGKGGPFADAVAFVRIDNLKGGAPPDEVSITTNAAGHKGELRLKNMDDDEDYYLPYNYAGSLLWGAPTMWDGDTVQWTQKSGGDGYVAELAGFTTGGAIGAGHYYGMAVGGNSLGFHELPNVTTNTVVADEVHLTTDLMNGGETKKFRFAIPSGGDTFLVGRDGFLPFSPDALTNGAAEVKVDNSSIATNDAGEVELKGWRDMHNGFLGKTTGGELVSKELTPTNGLVKVDETDERFKVGIEGWDAGACSASLSSMLTDENDSNRTKHLLLAKFTDGADDELHYVPIGDVIKTNAPPKDITINGVTGTNFVFETESDSDVRFTVEQGEDGAIHIKVGVYWK